ncbi:Lrp/AsnC family transcriptional regulator [Alcaligenes endophyticus]|uniref:Lrp/AsnC family transcriptional regulator n=1 Tax=Alcaligenes endophyticus TaxID=1929088 RepID=A0ABT8EHC0_9BURK|nr:Lrp/AsnC family transcriptional regulator [Alcaligenes endophyticus]MCX5589669.1 Lrp/AsnC family transcriptional regulator [Alcaligenes endophyticus]MDN4120667.1 Lrp/AsnC family transcriptional regulator [Alcaligenes endophyticus]
MDKKDKIILHALQENATLSVQELADKASLSPTACWKRIQKLQQEGVISKQVCVLDRKKLGVPVTVFVAIRTQSHTPEWLEQFASGVIDIPEVVEVYRMSGDIDYLLKVVAPDIEGFDQIYKRLIRTAHMYDVSSSFSMEELKCTTALPLTYC